MSLYTPLERAVDRNNAQHRNSLATTILRMREMAVKLIGCTGDDPAAVITDMQAWAARIDQAGEDAIEAMRQPGAYADATRSIQRRLAAEYDRRFPA